MLITNMAVSADDTTDPFLTFVSPTPDNGDYQTERNVEINVSIEEENLDELKYNWNGINYTMYSDSLVLMMNFNNVFDLGENSAKIVDLSQSSKNGTVSGATWTSSGKYGGAFSFDGNNDAINIGIHPKPTKMTITAWIKTGIVAQERTIVSWGDNVVAEDRAIFRVSSAGEIIWGIDDHGVGWSAVASDNYADDDKWHFVAMTLESSGLAEFYIDGQSDGSGNPYRTYITQNQPMTIGAFKNGGSYLDSFDGTMDEVRIWDRSLSEAEIYQQYASNLKRYNETQWHLYVNQTKDATTELEDGIYTYQAFATDTGSKQASTEQRTIYINIEPSPPVPEASTLLMTSFGIISLLSLIIIKKKIRKNI
jgi:hypothetical protein